VTRFFWVCDSNQLQHGRNPYVGKDMRTDDAYIFSTFQKGVTLSRSSSIMVDERHVA